MFGRNIEPVKPSPATSFVSSTSTRECASRCSNRSWISSRTAKKVSRRRTVAQAVQTGAGLRAARRSVLAEDDTSMLDIVYCNKLDSVTTSCLDDKVGEEGA